MSKHFVVNAFIDKETLKTYPVGSVYESDSEERVDFLIEEGFLQANSEKNEVDEDGLIKHGGGYYELPNGEKVKGRENALKALEELKEASIEE
ncbi:hypothetical protein ABET51_02745 [Metabacillus fastidiosus]|uniref:hypothetical protein n=1 Tax=Metabacillus fastidiosus TaxID=1458 RepID=UPI003D2CA330